MTKVTSELKLVKEREGTLLGRMEDRFAWKRDEG
jgi:hypothetical protein